MALFGCGGEIHPCGYQVAFTYTEHGTQLREVLRAGTGLRRSREVGNLFLLQLEAGEGAAAAGLWVSSEPFGARRAVQKASALDGCTQIHLRVRKSPGPNGKGSWASEK